LKKFYRTLIEKKIIAIMILIENHSLFNQTLNKKNFQTLFRPCFFRVSGPVHMSTILSICHGRHIDNSSTLN